jgi:hypothetical protein
MQSYTIFIPFLVAFLTFSCKHYALGSFADGRPLSNPTAPPNPIGLARKRPTESPIVRLSRPNQQPGSLEESLTWATFKQSAHIADGGNCGDHVSAYRTFGLCFS